MLVKKVPGNLHISAHSLKHSFDTGGMNMTHVVHHLSFGKEISRNKWSMVQRLHPDGLLNAWSNRCVGRNLLARTSPTQSGSETLIRIIQDYPGFPGVFGGSEIQDGSWIFVESSSICQSECWITQDPVRFRDGSTI